MDMSIGDYALNLVLVALVVRQVSGKKLTLIGLTWPVVLVVGAGVKYLHGVPTSGNDLALVTTGGVLGTTLGCLCGLCTRIHRQPDGGLLAKATGLAALLWILGIGARVAFAIYAENGGATTIAQFSTRYSISGAPAWTACLVLMSLTEVLGRTALLGARAYRLAHRPVPEPESTR
ncbi:MAG: hypothetical protein QOJ73_4038 [Streptosporangiaceae bacterium]|jgi:hypothetical protein|nr:hypothetical protein [Streptosporangiaceae bacterium]